MSVSLLSSSEKLLMRERVFSWMSCDGGLISHLIAPSHRLVWSEPTQRAWVEALVSAALADDPRAKSRVLIREAAASMRRVTAECEKLELTNENAAECAETLAVLLVQLNTLAELVSTEERLKEGVSDLYIQAHIEIRTVHVLCVARDAFNAAGTECDDKTKSSLVRTLIEKYFQPCARTNSARNPKIHTGIESALIERAKHIIAVLDDQCRPDTTTTTSEELSSIRGIHGLYKMHSMITAATVVNKFCAELRIEECWLVHMKILENDIDAGGWIRAGCQLNHISDDQESSDNSTTDKDRTRAKSNNGTEKGKFTSNSDKGKQCTHQLQRKEIAKKGLKVASDQTRADPRKICATNDAPSNPLNGLSGRGNVEIPALPHAKLSHVGDLEGTYAGSRGDTNSVKQKPPSTRRQSCNDLRKAVRTLSKEVTENGIDAKAAEGGSLAQDDNYRSQGNIFRRPDVLHDVNLWSQIEAQKKGSEKENGRDRRALDDLKLIEVNTRIGNGGDSQDELDNNNRGKRTCLERRDSSSDDIIDVDGRLDENNVANGRAHRKRRFNSMGFHDIMDVYVDWRTRRAKSRRRDEINFTDSAESDYSRLEPRQAEKAGKGIKNSKDNPIPSRHMLRNRRHRLHHVREMEDIPRSRVRNRDQHDEVHRRVSISDMNVAIASGRSGNSAVVRLDDDLDSRDYDSDVDNRILKILGNGFRGSDRISRRLGPESVHETDTFERLSRRRSTAKDVADREAVFVESTAVPERGTSFDAPRGLYDQAPCRTRRIIAESNIDSEFENTFTGSYRTRDRQRTGPFVGGNTNSRKLAQIGLLDELDRNAFTNDTGADSNKFCFSSSEDCELIKQIKKCGYGHWKDIVQNAKKNKSFLPHRTEKMAWNRALELAERDRRRA